MAKVVDTSFVAQSSFAIQAPAEDALGHLDKSLASIVCADTTISCPSS